MYETITKQISALILGAHLQICASLAIIVLHSFIFSNFVTGKYIFFLLQKLFSNCTINYPLCVINCLNYRT